MNKLEGENGDDCGKEKSRLLLSVLRKKVNWWLGLERKLELGQGGCVGFGIVGKFVIGSRRGREGLNLDLW